MPRIRRKTFEDRFCKLFEKGLGNFFISIQIDPITEQFSIVQELQRLDVILEVDLTLRPSNPDHSEYWAGRDEKLKAMRAKSMRETILGSENNGGLNIKDDAEVLSGLYMAEDGYGEASIRGRREGKIRRISSRDAQIKHNGPNDDQDSLLVLGLLIAGFAEVLRRLL